VPDFEPYVLMLLVTATVTYLLTPLVRRGAIKVGAMHGARERDVHEAPVPLLGGVAMFGGLAAGLWAASQIGPLRTVLAGTKMASGLLLAGALIVIVGFVDDRWEMTPITKLAGQVAAGAILVFSGAELSWLPEPGGRTFIPTPDQAAALTILVVVATINAVNFIDGLDGLAAGIVCIAAVSFFLYYYRLTTVLGLSGEAGPALAASALLAGACIGFLPHNFHPARIFMGDTGAMLLGLLLAYVPISSISSLDPSSLTNYKVGTLDRFPEILPLLLPAAIMVIPYADLTLAVIRRTRAGLSPLASDRGHLHHRLLDIGHSHRSSVLIMYLWAALFSITIVWLSIARTQAFVFAVTTLCAVMVLLLMSMPRLRWWRRRRGGRPAALPGPVAASPSPGGAMPSAAGTMPSPSPGGTVPSAAGTVLPPVPADHPAGASARPR
jgi:UDP-GlcNAc:undecaprenyl-phosphate GlcNAc-1-phosphate transferase